jgi:outer membrane protein assembly factor BamB
VLVLGIAATVTVVLWPDYPALKFHPLGTARHVKPAVPLGSSFSAVAVRGGRAYFVSTDDSPQGNETLGVVAADTATGKPVWTNTSVAGADDWNQLVVTPDAVVVFAARDYETGTRLMVVLDPKTGRRLWTKAIGGDDNVMFTGSVAVQVDVPGKRLVGLAIGDGRQIWTHANPVDHYQLSTAALIKSTTVADDSGPAGTDGTALTAPLDDDTRIVQIGADKSATVIDAQTGKVQRRLTNVADPDDDVVVHNGRLIVAEAGDARQVVEFDLVKAGQPKVLYNPPDAQTRVAHLSECGADRVCFVTTSDFADATAKVVAVDVAEGKVLWSHRQTGIKELVPVGESVLAVQDSPAQVTLFDPNGHVTWTMAGEVARLDAGNLLLFTKALSTGLDDLSLAGQHLGDKTVQLGPLLQVTPSTCAWDTEVIACAGDKDFQIREFAG